MPRTMDLQERAIFDTVPTRVSSGPIPATVQERAILDDTVPTKVSSGPIPTTVQERAILDDTVPTKVTSGSIPATVQERAILDTVPTKITSGPMPSLGEAFVVSYENKSSEQLFGQLSDAVPSLLVSESEAVWSQLFGTVDPDKLNSLTTDMFCAITAGEDWHYMVSIWRAEAKTGTTWSPSGVRKRRT
eukprot:gene10563-12216_t